MAGTLYSLADDATYNFKMRLHIRFDIAYKPYAIIQEWDFYFSLFQSSNPLSNTIKMYYCNTFIYNVVAAAK